MTRSDLARVVGVKLELSHGYAEEAVAAFFDTLTHGLTRGDRVELRGFGSFVVKNYDGYMGRNPRTSEPLSVPPKRLPKFRAGKDLKAVIND